MECRRSLVVALGLLTGVVGCTHPFAFLRGTDSQGRTNSEMVHQASTYVAFADFRAASAFSTEHPPAAQQQYREDARLSYQKALEVDPKCVQAHLGLARLYQRSDDHVAAEACYQKAITLKPRDASLWHELALCQCRRRDFAAGIESLRKAVELDPQNRQYLTTLGYTQARAGRMQDGFQTLARVHGEARAHLDMAKLFRHMNQPEMAQQHLTQALTIDPHLPAAYRLRAELEGKAPAGDVRTVGHTEPAPPQPQPTVQHVPAPMPPPAVSAPLPVIPNQTQDTSVPRPIRMPPLPIVNPAGR